MGEIYKVDGFDQVMPLNPSRSEVGGYIKALNEEFYIHLTVIENTVPRKVKLRGTHKLQELLHPVLETLEEHLGQCNTTSDMLLELRNLLETQLKNRLSNEVVTHPAEYYGVLLQQIQECGWNNVHYVNTDLDVIHLKINDDFDREHILKISLPSKFPDVPPKCECDLPQDFKFKWMFGNTLHTLLLKFMESVKKYYAFWNNMDEIDENTWVLEPENISRRDCKRRIAITTTASLLLIVDPITPSAVPLCHYLGPERIVGPVREKFNKNIYLWNEYESVLKNLKNVLETEFPSPSTSSKSEFCVECGICYAYQLGDSTPDISCNDPNCNQPFHHVCLYEYVRTLPNVRHSFNKLFGECPYCSKLICCTVP